MRRVLKPLIYIELYKEPTFQYVKKNVETLRLLSKWNIIECDNFSDEITFGLLQKLVDQERCTVIINSTQTDAPLGLVPSLIRKVQKIKSPLYLVSEHSLFPALARRNETTYLAPTFETVVQLIKESE